MIIIGHKEIPSEKFEKISDITSISKTAPNSTILFNFSFEILKFAKNSEVPSASIVSTLEEAIFSEVLQAKYIVADLFLAKKIQKIADNYMYDAKILTFSKYGLKEIAEAGIDGVYFGE